MKTKIDFSKIAESDVIVNYVVQRFNKGLGTIIFVIGLPGTGKSSTCARLAELISIALHGENKITVDNFVDSQLEFLSFVRNVQYLGSCCIPDEFGVLFPARRAMSKDNVSGGKVFDTVRKKQMIILANAPLLGSMDSHMRALGDILVETLRINRTQKVVVSKALRLQTNPRSGKTYLHRFQRNGREVHRMYTYQCNEQLWKDYEHKKDRFLDDLYEKLKFESEKQSIKLMKEMGKIKPVRPLTANEIMAYQLVFVKKMTHQKASEVMGVTRNRITAIVANIEKKSGIPLENMASNITKPT